MSQLPDFTLFFVVWRWIFLCRISIKFDRNLNFFRIFWLSVCSSFGSNRSLVGFDFQISDISDYRFFDWNWPLFSPNDTDDSLGKCIWEVPEVVWIFYFSGIKSFWGNCIVIFVSVHFTMFFTPVRTYLISNEINVCRWILHPVFIGKDYGKVGVLPSLSLLQII